MTEVYTHPPAKLNLFLELLGKRDDGFHELDTVMVAVNWCDQLSVRRTNQPGIQLTVRHLPSRQVLAKRFNRDAQSEPVSDLLDVPEDGRNLVHRALSRFVDHFKISSGLEAELLKSIPSGAGMGGASSNAAAALRCAADLYAIPANHADLLAIASSLGSDVPFFMETQNRFSQIARVRGRGEKLTHFPLPAQLNFVVVFPAFSLSTKEVYSQAVIPSEKLAADSLIDAICQGRSQRIDVVRVNRLQEPATKIAPQINEILDSLWQKGLSAVQLTGSGSACFGIARNAREARCVANRLVSQLEPGNRVVAVESVTAASPVLRRW